MKTVCQAVVASLLLGRGILAQKRPLLPEKEVAALANELSGESAKRNVEGIARFHRQRGSQGFHAAAELVAERLRASGLGNVEIMAFPSDGKIFYGTQRSRPAWDAEFAELRQVLGAGGDGQAAAIVENEQLLESYEAEPIVLAEDSESADVTTELVDVGEGSEESDYAGKQVKGKIVLVGAQPGAVQDLAVGKFGAVGIVSYAQNQQTAWWGEDENLIRWGHLETFSPNKTFAFMVTLKAARSMKDRLAKGREIRLHALVRAGQHPGNYEVVTAIIPGAEATRKDEEIAFSCHLDHQRPGANDNASGCATILEAARTLQKLIAEGKLLRPARTMRFLFPPEIEGTLALLNAKPEFARRIKAVVHMDMVGGGQETKAVFHVTRGPMSLPSFVADVAWAFAAWVNDESYQFAATGKADYPMVAPEGGKEPLGAEYSSYTMGSDHDVYQDSSFGIPAIYLNDWPDRYIHTNFDSAANIDPTKLKRAAFIGAASGYYLAMAHTQEDLPGLEIFEATGRSRRREFEPVKRLRFPPEEQSEVAWNWSRYERAVANSTVSWFGEKLDLDIGTHEASRATGDGLLKFKRKPEPKGPLAVFGYDYFEDHAKAAGVARPKLPGYRGWWGSGEEYAYEALNFADGKRNVEEIRDALSAEYGPVPLELVVAYLKALEKISVLVEVK